MSGGAVASALMTTTTRDDRQEVAAVTRESSMRASTSTSSNSSNGTMEEAVIDATRHASSLQTAGVNADAVPRAPSPSSSVKRSPNDFIFLRTIGEGSFSTVYHGKEVATRNEYAIKVCNKMQIKRENKIELIHRERDVMARLSTGNSHPFFVKLYCTFQDSERLYFAMSLAKNGELLTYLRRLGSFDDEVAQFYAAEIVLALQHLHSLGIVHRDLKPENILLGADNHILISDFGSSKILGQQDDGVLPTRRITAIRRSSDDDATTTSAEDEIPAITSPPRPTRSSFVGTAQYVSPEVLNGKPVQQACDYWALGAIVYQMIAGLPPFRGVNEYLIFQKIIKIDFSFPEGFPDDARDLVSQFLVLNADERLGSVERGGAESVMNHRYFAGIDWTSLPQRDPPALKPYLPASGDEPAFHSEYHYPNDVEPGLDDAAMTRLMGLQLGLFSAVPTVPVEIAMENKTMEERRRKLDAQRKENKFHRFVNDNIILKSGFVDKKKGLFARRRMFLLTEGPHLYYVDPANMELKGEIPWCRELRTEAKNFRTFFVHTPNRTYYLFDPARQAVQWCQAIESVRERYFSHT